LVVRKAGPMDVTKVGPLADDSAGWKAGWWVFQTAESWAVPMAQLTAVGLAAWSGDWWSAHCSAEKRAATLAASKAGPTAERSEETKVGTTDMTKAPLRVARTAALRAARTAEKWAALMVGLSEN